MFYRPGKDDHGLPHDPFKACVVPRPIGWISTLSPTGEANLAPYSQFNNLTFDPPYVMFSANQTPSQFQKDTVKNAEATGVFCWNLATYDLRSAVNITAEQVPSHIDEFTRAGLEKTPSKVVSVLVKSPDTLGTAKADAKAKPQRVPIPMVAASPVRFECEYYTTLRLPGNPPMGTVDVVIGKVVGIHIEERVLTEGKVDIQKTVPIARCGYYEYAVVRETFEMRIPGADEKLLGGLEGSVKINREMYEDGVEGVDRES
ncbi:hypothetical protein IQ07DRAFT_555422 [Pyrenochaeta sp. DS3sAY3a]|nr:hypothetical protein IQ07DRAFT_555422 [Pyrenochaeta sp. DS3sAY3a]